LKVFIATPIDVLDSNFVKFGRGKIGEIAFVYLTKKIKISRGSLAVAIAWIALKICQGQFPKMYAECSTFHPNWFTFGGIIAERVNTAKTRRKMDPIFG